MRDAPHLLAGILAYPDDDAPRFVYAAWFDKHNQPDRAEPTLSASRHCS